MDYSVPKWPIPYKNEEFKEMKWAVFWYESIRSAGEVAVSLWVFI